MKEQLQKLRKSKNLTQEDIANIINVKLTTYQKYERDVISPPYDKLIKLADFYGVTTDYLLGREPMPTFNDLNIDEEEVISKYMSFPPEIRACLLDVLTKLVDVSQKIRNVQNKNNSATTKEVPETNDIQKNNEDDEYETITIETTPEKLRADLERAEEEQRNSQKDVS